MTGVKRREQLLDVTTQIVAEHGFHDVSVEAVSRLAGITRAVVYQHFDDLQALLDAVVEREMSRALSQVSKTTLADLSGGDPREIMVESLRAYLAMVRDHPTTWRFVLMPPEGAPRIMRKRIADGRAAVLARMARAVQPVIDNEAEPGDAELTARLLSAMSDEYARLVLIDPKRFPPERLVGHARWWLGHASL